MSENKALDTLHTWINCYSDGNFYCHDNTFRGFEEPMKFTCKWCGETFEATPNQIIDDIETFFKYDKVPTMEHYHSCEKLRNFELMREYYRVVSLFSFQAEGTSGSTTINNLCFMPMFSPEELATAQANGYNNKVKYKCLLCGEEFMIPWNSFPNENHKCKEGNIND